MLEDLEMMWDSHLRKISVAKHGIELDPSNQLLLHSTRYHARHKARDIENQEVEQMPAENVIEPAHTV